jgi:hypothetical protein
MMSLKEDRGRLRSSGAQRKKQMTMAPDTQPEAETPIILGPREQVFHLLAEASEIEHTLMCTYLYAAFSLKQPRRVFTL